MKRYHEKKFIPKTRLCVPRKSYYSSGFGAVSNKLSSDNLCSLAKEIRNANHFFSDELADWLEEHK